jgi:hypothetical protein
MVDVEVLERAGGTGLLPERAATREIFARLVADFVVAAVSVQLSA